MKRIALAIGALGLVAAPTLLAQEYRVYRYDPYERFAWEAPRYAETYRYDWRDDRFRDDRWRDQRYAWRRGEYECWNPRAGHYEGVREGEYQDDLDFSRCRLIRRYGWR